MAGTRTSLWKRTISLYPEDVDFVETPPRQLHLECPICMGLLFNPHIVSCCGHHFCEECLEKVKTENKPCPMCKEDYNSIPDKSLQRNINELSIACPNSKKKENDSDDTVCDWVGELGHVEDHLNIGHRYGNCQCLVVGCTYGCGYSDKRTHLVRHEQTVCPKRPFSCDYCNDYSSTCEDVTERHWLECPDYPVECPNTCNTRYLSRGKLEEHLNTTCELQLISCSFEWAGCEFKTQRAKLQAHLDNSMGVHLQKVCSASYNIVTQMHNLTTLVADMKKQNKTKDLIISKLEREDEADKQKMVTISQEVSLLKDKVKKLEYENETLKQQISEVYSESKAEKENLSRRSFSLESSIGVPPFIFVMKNFQETLADKSSYLSPPFYTHIGGYRLCVRVTPSGIFFGEGSHVSLTVCVMKGVFDDYLQWPFRGVVKIALIDRLNDTDHVTDTITFDQRTSAKVSGRVKDGQMNEVGLISYHFVDLAWLKPNSKRSRCFVPDNCLHFKVLNVTITP